MFVSSLSRRRMIIQSTGAALALAGCRGRSTRGSGRSRVGLLYFAPEAGAELCMKGLFDGLTQAGFSKDSNLDVISSHAQGEISNIPMLVQNFMTQGVDLIMTLTTPCLTAACTVAFAVPILRSLTATILWLQGPANRSAIIFLT